jgi:uncharacterized protein (TIGR02679 family)
VIPPGLEAVLRCAARRRERRGELGDARVTVENLTQAEANALDGLPWPRPRPKTFLVGERRALSLARLEAALEAAALSPSALYAEALGRPLRDLPRERGELQAARQAFWQDLDRHPVVARAPALQAWFTDARRKGRVGAADRGLVSDALRVVDWITARNGEGKGAQRRIDRALLAAQLFDGRAHALDAGTSLEGLARRLLAAVHNVSEDVPARLIWAGAGIDVDATSTSVLTLCLRARGDTPLEVALGSLHGTHVILTLAQIESGRVAWANDEVYVCENPSILRSAERVLGARCPPIVCAAGWPTDAVRVLLSQLADSGATLRYHGDFDHEGAAIFRHLEREVGVVAWRYGPADYEAALIANSGRELPAIPTTPRGPSGLEHALEAEGRAVAEELVVDRLLTDLADGALSHRESHGPRRPA